MYFCSTVVLFNGDASTEKQNKYNLKTIKVMQETVKKVLTGDFNRKKALMFAITALFTIVVWNLPIDCFGIDRES